MEHLSLEIFDLEGTGSKYAMLPEDASITITDTSEIFASGDVWSHSFTLNVRANAHIFGTAGDMHGSRLHEQINKRRARLWVEGVALYLGYLKLDDEVEVDAKGNVDVIFESGQKTFDEMIEGTKAREVSVGDVVIGVALNRKRVSNFSGTVGFTLGGLEGYAAKDERLRGVDKCRLSYMFTRNIKTPYVQRWPKLVKSSGEIWNDSQVQESIDYTNIQTPYDESHPFCNINICYPLKVNNEGEEISTRGYTLRLAHGKPTTDGGDNQTRYNNAPNFYLLHFIKHLFKDLGINIDENQAYDVEDLRRVFMLNYGCFYEEIEDTDSDTTTHTTPEDKLQRYGQYYMPIIDKEGENYLLKDWKEAGQSIIRDDIPGKVLLREVKVEKSGLDGTLLSIGSVEGRVVDNGWNIPGTESDPAWGFYIEKSDIEQSLGAYSAYLAYATNDNYPNVDISEIIEAMKAMFGVRFIFRDNYKRVRIILLRNIFRNQEVQTINCEVVDSDIKVENCVRGFRMTYGKGTDDTNYYYKGFNDMFTRVAKTWKDTKDKHDYSQWDLNAEYGDIKQYTSAMNKKCYVTPINGNAYAVKVDEEEDVLFPSLFEVGGFMDAEDGDCSRLEDDGKTVEEVQINASPVIMNEIGDAYASFFGGELKAPTPDNYEYAQKISTFGRVTTQSINYNSPQWWPTPDESAYFRISGFLDIYIGEGFKIRMMDNYGISNSGTPFDEKDAGLCFGIMRSSGEESRIFYDKDDIENEEPLNDYWEVIPGDGAIDHPDTCDNYGNEWDYNGTGEGVGNKEGRISLKLRAEKLNPYYDPESTDPNKQKQYLEITNPNLRNRGLCDQFYKEYSKFIREARIAKRTVRMELAQLLAIDKTKKVTIGDITGYIRKMQYSVNNKTGLGNVTMEIMYI